MQPNQESRHLGTDTTLSDCSLELVAPDVVLATEEAARLRGLVVHRLQSSVTVYRQITCEDVKRWIPEFINHKIDCGAEHTYVERLLTLLACYVEYLDGRDPTHEVNAAYVNYLDKRYNRSQTVWVSVRAVKNFGEWLERTRRISYEQNTFPTTLPYRPPRPKKTITWEQYEMVKEMSMGTKMYYIIVLCYNTMIRIGGACLLRWDDVNLDDRTIKTIDYKARKRGNYSRYAWEPNSDVDVMMRAMNAARLPEQEYVHEYWAERYIHNPHAPTDYINKWFACRGLKGIASHALRRSGISNGANGGIDFMTLSMISGHLNPQTLRSYVTPDIEVIRRAATRINEYAQKGQYKLGATTTRAS